MRVATRRLRAALRCFQDVLPPASAAFDQELGWLASGLAAVRDLDVQLLRLQELATVVSQPEQESLDAVREVLERDREHARTAMIDLLDSERYASMLRLGSDLSWVVSDQHRSARCCCRAGVVTDLSQLSKGREPPDRKLAAG
jgi:CHAD domain-containing protein